MWSSLHLLVALAPIAAAGHRVVLCDISAVMLGKARDEFARVAPGSSVSFVPTPASSLPLQSSPSPPDSDGRAHAQVRLVHCSAQDLPAVMPELVGGADLVLLHAVIEWLQVCVRCVGAA